MTNHYFLRNTRVKVSVQIKIVYESDILKLWIVAPRRQDSLLLKSLLAESIASKDHS